jgi:hypothetical protein
VAATVSLLHAETQQWSQELTYGSAVYASWFLFCLLSIMYYIYSIRFPRLVRERDDKTPEQATTADQILDMYNSQDFIKNNAAFTAEMNGQDDDDDDFL